MASVGLQKDKPLRDRAYLDYLRERPCICTGRFAYPGMAVDPAHLGTAGKGLKAPDNEAVPLLHEVHQSCHQHGEWTILSRDVLPRWKEKARGLYLIHLVEAGHETYHLTHEKMEDWPCADFIMALRVLARAEHARWLDGETPWKHSLAGWELR